MGCVIVLGGEVIAAAGNERELRNSPLAHAEMIAIEQAARHMGSWRLLNTVLYVTMEPCPMCAGGIVQARIPHLVWGAPDEKDGAAGTLYNVCQDERLARVGGDPADGDVPPLVPRLERRGDGRVDLCGVGEGVKAVHLSLIHI